MVIYKIVNKVNKKVYIGKTKESIHKRLEQHIKYVNYGKPTKLSRSINKYGSDNFDIEILEEVKNITSLNERERYWIKIYNSIEKGLNIASGGDGGDTLSKHPKKKEIFKKRSIEHPPKRGKESPNFKKVSQENIQRIVNTWNNLEIPYLKEVSKQVGYSTHICKRVLEEQGINIPTRHTTQKRLIEAGINKGSRNPNFTQVQKEYIRKRYVEDWVGCKNIAKELGYRSESPILNVINELGVKRSNSEWTQYSNRNRKHGKSNNIQ